MLGNGRLEAKCQDGETRLGQIRGQMRKKVSRPLGRYILQPSGCLLVPAGRLWIYCSRGVLARREIGGMGREWVKGLQPFRTWSGDLLPRFIPLDLPV